jgi:hypothetical protein
MKKSRSQSRAAFQFYRLFMARGLARRLIATRLFASDFNCARRASLLSSNAL